MLSVTPHVIGSAAVTMAGDNIFAVAVFVAYSVGVKFKSVIGIYV